MPKIYSPTLDYPATQEKLKQVAGYTGNIFDMPRSNRRESVVRLCKKLGIAPVEKGEID